MRALLRARDAKVLARKDAEELIENYRRLLRQGGSAYCGAGVLEGETVLPDEEALRSIASPVRCGFGTTEEFRHR